MGYFIRVLAGSDRVVPLSDLEQRLVNDGLDAKVELEEGTREAWTQIRLHHPVAQVEPGAGTIALIARHPVLPGSLGEGELAEFIEEVRSRKPKSAADWLEKYLPSVKAIYAFQIEHDGAERGRGWDAIHALQGEIWAALGGIFQADYEGFSNEDGYHILWQFSDGATGSWKMALLDEHDNWVEFAMDLGDREQRDYFLAGKTPPRVEFA